MNFIHRHVYSLMMNKKTVKNAIFGIFISILCITGLIFAYLESVNTTLGILPPSYEVVYTPSYVTGVYMSGPVYVTVTGSGIRENTSGIYHNGTYTFEFYRGTGQFTTGAEYSSGNIRTFLQTTKTIDRIDDIWPTFAGVTDGVTYNAGIMITFSDDRPGVTATINGNPFTNGNSISTNGTYQLIVTDAVGHSTGATFIIYLNTTPPGGGGGGGGSAIGVRELIKKKCETRSCFSYYYDDLCGPCTPPKTILPEKPVIPGNRPPYYYTNPIPPDIEDSPYPKEWNDTYIRAYNLGITTIPDIKKVELDTPLLRKFAAKMASEFAIKVVGLTPDGNKICNFKDISKETPELQYYMRLSCKLGIMGLDYYGIPDKIFNPNYVVTRDQFVTILSRIIFRDEYNIKPGELTLYDQAKNFISHSLSNISQALGIDLTISTPLDRYSKHLKAIKKLGIITDYTLTTKEFRNYVMIVMYKLDKMGITKVKNMSAAETKAINTSNLK